MYVQVYVDKCIKSHLDNNRMKKVLFKEVLDTKVN